jgi:protein gp37
MKTKQSKIQWTGVTWNPWHGCKKVSAGCKFCYMYRDKERYGQQPTKVLKSKSMFKEPLKWKDPQLIFTCSWSDWFIEDADAWRPEAWEVIKNTPHHTYQILTKRPERILECLPPDWGNGYPNVWIGVSVENDMARHRIGALSKVPAHIRFISAEPLIDELHLEEYSDILSNYYHWIILGGESGNKIGKYRYRECKVEWFRKLVDVARSNDVKVFVKQLGTHLAKELKLNDRHGGDLEEWGESLRIREFPENMEKFAIKRKAA